MSSPSALFPPGPHENAEHAEPPPPAVVKALRESPRRPGRYLVTLVDGRDFLVGAGVLANVGATRTGVTLSPEAVALLVRESQLTDLSDRAVGFLARGRRTRRELEVRLRRRDADPALIQIALDRLHEAGIVSDANVAQAEAAARLRRGETPGRVRQVLRRKGVAASEVTAAVNQAVFDDGFDELTACREAATKRARALRSYEPAVAVRRLSAFLLRRGFSGSLVHRVVREAIAAAPEDEHME